MRTNEIVFVYLATTSDLFGALFPVLKTDKTVNVNSMAKKVNTPMATHISSPPEKYTRGKQIRGRTRMVSITEGNACENEGKDL